jgi:hypothetical protein
LKTAPNAAASETQAGNSLWSASEISSSVISASEQKNRRRAQFEKRHKTAQHTHAEVLGKFDLFLDCFLPQLTTRVYLWSRTNWYMDCILLFSLPATRDCHWRWHCKVCLHM